MKYEEEGVEPRASKSTLHMPRSYKLFLPAAIISKLTTIQDVNLLMNSEEVTWPVSRLAPASISAAPTHADTL